MRNFVIVAGGCKGLDEAQIAGLEEQVVSALCTYKGTVISGGTKSGVCAIVGDAVEAGGKFTAVGYTPKLNPDGETVSCWSEPLDSRYHKQEHTDGERFSVREALAYWDNIISSGADPKDVLLVGANGGAISILEFKLALAMGATLVLIEGSGRAADELINDPVWGRMPNLKTVSLGDVEALIAYLR